MGAAHPLDIAKQAALHGDFEASYEILKGINDDPRADFNLGWHYCRQGELLKGMEYLARGRWIEVFGSPPLGVGTPIWRGESLKGKTILLHGEGGMGDVFINLRFARNLKKLGATVIVSCYPSMFSLLRKQNYVDMVVSMDHARGVGHDYWIPAMSAALALGIEYDTLDGSPYIAVKPARLRGLNIGLCWHGSPEFSEEEFRRFDKDWLLGSMRFAPKAKFHCLQKGESAPGLEAHELADWLETATVIAGLDLVISSCTAVAHLAAAMGVPTWVIVPVCSYYTWALPGEKSPWYQHAKVFRQKRLNDWAEPFVALRKELSGHIDSGFIG